MHHDLLHVHDFEREGNVSMLIEMLGSRDATALADAARALGKLKARAAGAALTRAMDDESKRVRVYAIVAAGQLGSPESLDRLIEFVRTGQESEERPQAVIALGLIGDERAVPSLVSALDTPKLRGWAVEALGWIGGDDADVTLRHLHIPVWHRLHRIRRRAVSRIAQRTGVGSPLVSVLVELVTAAAVALLGAGVVIGLGVALLDARLWPNDRGGGSGDRRLFGTADVARPERR